MKRGKSTVEKGALETDIFRKILHTSKYLQIALLSIKTGAKIYLDTHESMDQFVGFKGGTGKCRIKGQEYIVENNDVIMIPAGTEGEIAKYDCHHSSNISGNLFNSDPGDNQKAKAKNLMKKIS
jgi:mannose-6-phosphate isomerase-like protein (cupin superfamily)